MREFNMAMDLSQLGLIETLLLQSQNAPNTLPLAASSSPLTKSIIADITEKQRQAAQWRANVDPNQLTSFSSASPDETAKRKAEQEALYRSYLNKALDYNNVSLNDLNADASAISGGIRRYLTEARNWIQGETDINFPSALENSIPDALMAAQAYIRNIGPNGQYQTGSLSGSTTSWDSLLNSSREEQLKSFFDTYGGVQGFTSNPEDTIATDSELATIRHDYEAFTARLAPQLRRAFNISDAEQAKKIAGYMALQLLHAGTEHNTALPWFQDPYDYHSSAAEKALGKLEGALKDPNILAVMDKMVRTNTALNEFEAANKAYNDLVTARNAREAQLQALYGNTRNTGQHLVSMLTDQALDNAIRAKKGPADTVNTLYNL